MSLTNQQAEAILKPLFAQYDHVIENDKFDEIEQFYHTDGVLVHKGTNVYHGRKAIGEVFRQFSSQFGKAKTTLSNTKYEGVGDYLLIHSDYNTVTEKAGTINGKFLQIWKKDDGRYQVYHDEFEITA